jgi:hypothetical protein
MAIFFLSAAGLACSRVMQLASFLPSLLSPVWLVTVSSSVVPLPFVVV